MIIFRVKTDFEFDLFRKSTVKTFAASNVIAGNWKESESESKASALFEQLLPDGNSTTGHEFYTILENRDEIGAVWVYVEGTTAFIFDIEISKSFRGIGLGKKSMASLETNLKEQGVNKIKLHVFGHNTIARNLYSKVGFLETDVTMEKTITETEMK